jgi:NifU-like protein involved in Fe-S cluster formation
MKVDQLCGTVRLAVAEDKLFDAAYEGHYCGVIVISASVLCGGYAGLS